MPKTVFITGASSGIGRATAALFFERGWNVVATMRAPEHDTALRALDPARVLLLRLDVRDPAAIAAAVQAATARFGRVDVLVNNAGYGQYGPFELVAREAVAEQFAVNVFGAMDVTRALLPSLRAAHGGVVNVSSGLGLFTFPLLGVYAASKFALEGWTEALAHELRAAGAFAKSVVPHDDVAGTDFRARAAGLAAFGPAEGASAAQEGASAAQEAAAAYAPFVAEARALYARASAPGTTVRDVAEAVFAAATDGSERLRYFVGTDAGGFIKLRYESRSDEEYMARLRAAIRGVGGGE